MQKSSHCGDLSFIHSRILKYLSLDLLLYVPLCKRFHIIFYVNSVLPVSGKYQSCILAGCFFGGIHIGGM